MIFYISDLHIGHKAALRFDQRPFDIDNTFNIRGFIGEFSDHEMKMIPP